MIEREKRNIEEVDIETIKQRLMAQLRNELPVLRAKSRLSQELLAEKIGVSRQTYSSIETGKREITWTTFLALVACFQNNEQTRQMINGIGNFEEYMAIVMDRK